MAQLKDGIDFVTGNVLSFQQMNRMKNNWYSGADAPANPVNGMVWVKNDGITYVYFGAAWNPLSTVAEFLDLTDTPAAYAGEGGKFVKVNAVPDALEFAAIVWGDVSKAGSNLTDLATRQHAGLTNITSDQHHAQLHATEHEVGGGDLLAFADIPDFGDWLDQAVKEASSPLFANLNLGAAPLIRQASGALTFQTNEGVNTNTVLDIKGKGTGEGKLQIYDEDDEEYLYMTCVSNISYIRTEGTAPSDLYLQNSTPSSIRCWSNITEGNPYLYLHGWHATDVDWMRMRVEADGDALIEAENNLNLRAGGGEISFGDENLVTTGTIRCDKIEITDVSNYIITTTGNPLDIISYHGIRLYNFTGLTAKIGNASDDLSSTFYGNVGISQTTFGTNMTKGYAQSTGVAPTTSPADCFQMYSADIGGVAGKAGAHFRDEEGNVVSIGSGGLLFTGTARTINALWIDAQAIKAPQTNPAELISHGTLETPAFQFADAIEANQESVTFNMRIPNRMDRSVAPSLSIGWSADGVSPGNCRWQLEYLWTSPGEDTGAAAQETLPITGTADDTPDGFVVSTFTGIDVPSATDVCLHCRITRLSADVLDTIADTVELHGVCLNWTSNKLGLPT